MTILSVLYPNVEGKKFDMEYYLGTHIPMVQKALGAACKRVVVEQGVSGREAGSPPAYVVMCHMHFDSAEAIDAAFAPHAPELTGDIPNYTDIQPVFLISEVKM